MKEKGKAGKPGELEALMEERIREQFSHPKEQKLNLTAEKLEDINKRLPSWSLEPPQTFLK